ncbi:MAG TPA: hypothetical protein VFX12_12920 [Vicinamibacterales bacterium]|nr:hypothetical protein [Vicinamibacterales bacterium]
MIVAVAVLAGFARPVAPASHLQVSGTGWRTPDGAVFAWRGITAFRLVEMVAHGHAAAADAYLAWAASRKLTVVRVLAMAHGLFRLTPADGVDALPRLLDLAGRHGLHVEVVALADTGSYDFDLAAHVKAIGAICASHGNAVLEIANEPAHPTQRAVVHDPATLRRWRALVASDVPVSLGSVERDAAFGAGDYVTWHPPRTADWVARLEDGRGLLERFRKPVVVDEPMGAADAGVRGRRDADPEHFRAAARICRRLGLAATFHYENGLQAARPTPRETACLNAWLAGLGV